MDLTVRAIRQQAHPPCPDCPAGDDERTGFADLLTDLRDSMTRLDDIHGYLQGTDGHIGFGPIVAAA